MRCEGFNLFVRERYNMGGSDKPVEQTCAAFEEEIGKQIAI